MKKKLFIIALSLLCSCSAATVFAQAEEENATTVQTPRWVSQKGFWVVETNLKQPGVSILYFYNNDNLLVYKELVEGTTLNIARRRTKMKLKKVLEQSLVLYAQRKKSGENEMFVINIMNRR